MIAYGLLIPVFAWTFYKVWYGKRYKLILFLVAFLELACVSYCIFGISNVVSVWDAKKEYYRGVDTWDYVNVNSAAIGNFFFSEAHWMLAFYYFKVSKNMPKIISGKGDQAKSYVALKWVGIVANALFSLVQSVLGTIYLHKNVVKEPQEVPDLWVAYLTLIFVVILWNVSGCLLISSILTIRKFLKERNDDG